jgi:hypothetical protein
MLSGHTPSGWSACCEMKPQCSHTIMTAGMVVLSSVFLSIVACTSIRENSLTVH